MEFKSGMNDFTGALQLETSRGIVHFSGNFSLNESTIEGGNLIMEDDGSSFRINRGWVNEDRLVFITYNTQMGRVSYNFKREDNLPTTLWKGVWDCPGGKMELTAAAMNAGFAVLNTTPQCDRREDMYDYLHNSV